MTYRRRALGVVVAVGLGLLAWRGLWPAAAPTRREADTPDPLVVDYRDEPGNIDAADPDRTDVLPAADLRLALQTVSRARVAGRRCHAPRRTTDGSGAMLHVLAANTTS